MVCAIYQGCMQGHHGSLKFLSLRWYQVDFEKGFVSWQTTKSGKAKLFPFTKRLEEILLQQKEQVSEVERKLSIKTPYVFIRFSDGKPLVYADKFAQREKACHYFYKCWH